MHFLPYFVKDFWQIFFFTTNNPVTIEHFDLQGRRINAMRQPRGVIIERRNGQVQKVMGKQ